MAIKEYETPVDVSPLAGLGQLQRLSMDNFWGGQFVGVETLLSLPSLKAFRLDQGTGSDSQILIDTEALEGNAGLEELGIINCVIKDLETEEDGDFGFVSRFGGLKRLYLDACGLTDISFVEELGDLRACSLMDNDIRDLSPLLACRKLEAVSVDREAAAGVEFPGDVMVNTEIFEKIYE